MVVPVKPLSMVSQGTVENGNCGKALICVRKTRKQLKNSRLTIYAYKNNEVKCANSCMQITFFFKAICN